MSNVLAYDSTPEDVLVMHPEAGAGIKIDAIECALSRAQSVINLLSPYFNGIIKDVKPSDGVIADALWSIQGELELIRKLANHAHESQRQLASSVKAGD
ncbi:hypothetical protein [Thiopseudomonas alkaliphila]|uniref:hypothetical protein n=1 Tax=Thiopseudomonas alkaliphila TaxID=1697053 RepID=UPI002577A169|nr:hypothetical protein [Thiopseudomonas alkaliphila]MDM1707699.1 hypothetical protein [Thiopseudomonas alkaliphila]